MLKKKRMKNVKRFSTNVVQSLENEELNVKTINRLMALNLIAVKTEKTVRKRRTMCDNIKFTYVIRNLHDYYLSLCFCQIVKKPL